VGAERPARPAVQGGTVSLTRRQLLTRGLAALGALAPGPTLAWSRPAIPTLLARSSGRRLVVLGASFAGISAALTVKRLLPDGEVILVERASFFIFVPAVLRYLFGMASLDRITRGYASLEARGLRVVHTTVLAVDRDVRQVITADGRVDYDYLLIATGVRLAYEDVPGLAERPEVNLCPYDLGWPLRALRRRIAGFRGGHVVVSPPDSLYKCPPAPYEYALLWAAHLRRHRLRGKITVVDSRSKPTPLSVAPGLLRAMEANKPVLSYEPFTRVLSVDPARSTVETEAGRLRFDVLSIVPPNKAMPFVTEAGLGEPFIDVDPRTFVTTDERVYAVGDSADTPYAKTASTAAISGQIAGHYIGHALGARIRDPGAPHNVCYPLVSPDRALRLEVSWSHETDEAGTAHVKATGTSDNEAKASNLRLRHEWEARLLREMFGT
jgi:NADPH-dependent 2,4-dienoyl-CoA reductase/sulfur reductase-like enzyme